MKQEKQSILVELARGCLLFAVLAFPAATARAQSSYSLDLWMLGGRGASTGGAYTISDASGQLGAGAAMSGGDYSLTISCGANLTIANVAAVANSAGTIAYAPSVYPTNALSAKRVGNVTLNLTGDLSQSVVTLADGSYGLNNLPFGGTYVVTPSKSDDSPTVNGVNSLDMALIQRHVLGLTLLDTPYKLLAADVTGDGRINSLDLALIQRLILKMSSSFPAGLWRFVPADYAFPDPTAPWAAPTNRSYAGVLADVTGGDFVAIKLGDVANLWKVPPGGQGLVLESPKRGGVQAAGMPEVGFAVEAQRAQAGEVVNVPVKVSGFRQVSSVQFSLSWDPAVLRYVGTGNYGLRGLGVGSFGATQAESGRLAFAWYDPEAVGVTIDDGTEIFGVSFEVLGKAGSLSAVALAGAPTAQQVSVDFGLAGFGAKDGSVSVVGPYVAVYQPSYAVGLFQLSVSTEKGHSYTLESSDTLSPAKWAALPAVVGDGTVMVLKDMAATNQQRFYRVRVE